jgi:hypothetical protein
MASAAIGPLANDVWQQLHLMAIPQARQPWPDDTDSA